jgi:hypothetical protein
MYYTAIIIASYHNEELQRQSLMKRQRGKHNAEAEEVAGGHVCAATSE